MAIGNTGTKNKIINLANVEFTENGTYIPNKGVTGFGKVKVTVPPDAMKKPLYITPSATSNISVPTWDQYSGPFVDVYAKAIGYKKENRNVYNFENNYIGRMTPEKNIIDPDDNIIGKVSDFRTVYDENNILIGYADQKNNAFDFEDNQIGTVQANNIVINNEEQEIGKASTNEYVAYNNNQVEYVGTRKIDVRRVSSWIDSEISVDNIRQGHTILGVTGHVIELNGEERTANSSTSTQVLTPSSDKNAITKVTINPYTLQNKTVDPDFLSHTYHADSNYNGLSSVTVRPVDVQLIVDEEPKLVPDNIKKGVRLFGGQIIGTYDNYVAPVVEPISISPSIEDQLITPRSGVDGFNSISVDKVTSSIDSNIKPENIRRNVVILGVEGTFVVEKLQDKVVDPQPYQQVITFDSSEADGLNSVTINAVTSSIDEHITSENIKKDVTILGVTGEYDPQPIIQDPVTIDPTTLNQYVEPDEGYDGLGRVNINAVTSSIDPNILAENIKKNITILGVTGEYDPKPNYQAEKIVQPVTSGDIEVTADPTYDALLKVIVKAVTASIDPNILPKNIRKNVSILGVLGTMEEGGGQKWFDFSGIQNFVELNQDAWSEGGQESIRLNVANNNYELESFINDTFPSIQNINAIMFTQIYGYEDEEITDDIIKQCYINFIGGQFYESYDHFEHIENQIRYFYPFINDYNVDGLTIGLDNDDGSARVMKLYVLIDSLNNYKPVPVLVNGDMTTLMLPSGYDGFRYVKDISIPIHDVYIPKTNSTEDTQWVLKNEDAIRSRTIEEENQPNIIETSAYDLNYGTIDNETNIFGGYKLKNPNKLYIDKYTGIATQSEYGKTGYIEIPGDVEKQSGYYYYFKIRPSVMTNESNFAYTLASCNALFVIYLWRVNSNSYYNLGWRYSWSSSTTGDLTPYNYIMYPENTYWIRVYVSGTTARLDFSTNGTNWTNNINTVSSGYINPTNTNPIYIYSSSGPNTKLYATDCYITDSSGNIVYTTTDEMYIKKTSHTIIPSTRDMLLVNRDMNRYTIKYQGDETISFNQLNSSNQLLDLGIGGYVEIYHDFNTTGKTWEICQHFRLPSVTSNANRYLATWTALKTSARRNCLWIDTDNCICWTSWYNNGSTNINGRLTNTTLSVDTSYYIKYGWNGSIYYMYVSTSPLFDSYVTSWTYNSTNSTYAESEKILIGNLTKTNSTSSIRYLYTDDYTYIKLNGKIIWKSHNGYSIRGNLVDYIDDGSAATFDAYLAGSNLHGEITNANVIGDVIIDQNGVATNFNQNSYINLLEAFSPENNNWEMVYKIKSPTTIDRRNLLIGGLTSFYNVGFSIELNSSSKIGAGISSNGESWNLGWITGNTTISLNTWYWIRLSFDGTQYLLELSTDGINYITEGLITSSTLIYQNENIVQLGNTATNVDYFSGEIDLTQCYIKINNIYLWQPNVITSYDYDWIFTQNPNWNYTGLTNLGKKGTLIVSDHNVYTWNQSKMKWNSIKNLTLNVNDPDAILYTEIIPSD